MNEANKRELRQGGSVLVRGDADLRRTLEFIVETERSSADPLFIATGGLGGEQLVETWYRSGGELGSGPAVIDIAETVRSAVSGASEPVDENSVVRGADDDLASARRAVETLLAERDSASRAVVIVDSLSSLLVGRELPAVVVFLDKLFDTLGQNDVGYVLLDREADSGIADTFRPMFDLTVDVDPGETDVTFRSGRSLVPPDTAFDLLTPPRRRHALRSLLAAPEPLSLDELAGELAAVEAFPDRERCRVALFHMDVPRLERAGVVRYDPTTDVVEALGPAAGLRPYLSLADQHDNQRWCASREG